MSSKDFNNKKFNKIYEENKIEVPYNNGYGNWKTENTSEKIQKNTVLTNNNFNRIFDKNVISNDTMQVYTNPLELFSKTNNVEELGQDKIDNFSGESNNLKFSDYKEAHTTPKIIDPYIKYNKKYNTLNELNLHRSNIPKLTRDELLEIEKNQELQKLNEQKRIERLSKLDNNILINYNKTHKLML